MLLGLERLEARAAQQAHLRPRDTLQREPQISIATVAHGAIPARERSKSVAIAVPGSAAALVVLGFVADLLAFRLLTGSFGMGIAAAQAAAAATACMLFYATAEALAYRHRGAWRWYLGLLPFLASCAPGILANMVLTSWLTGAGLTWIWAAAIGAGTGTAWNYGALDRHGWKP